MRYVETSRPLIEEELRGHYSFDVIASKFAVLLLIAMVIMELRSLGLPHWALMAVAYLLSLPAVRLLWFLVGPSEAKSLANLTTASALAITAAAAVLLRRYGVDRGLTDVVTSSLALFVGMLLGWCWLYTVHRLGVPTIWRKLTRGSDE